MDLERIETLKKFLQMDPADSFSRYALGLEYREGEPATALEHLHEVIRLDADYVGAYFMAGLIYSETGEFGRAREMLEQGISVAQRVGDDHALGEMQEALDTL